MKTSPIDKACTDLAKKVHEQIGLRFLAAVTKLEGRQPSKEDMFRNSRVRRGENNAVEYCWKGTPLVRVWPGEAKDGEFSIRISP